VLGRLPRVLERALVLYLVLYMEDGSVLAWVPRARESQHGSTRGSALAESPRSTVSAPRGWRTTSMTTAIWLLANVSHAALCVARHAVVSHAERRRSSRFRPAWPSKQARRVGARRTRRQHPVVPQHVMSAQLARRSEIQRHGRDVHDVRYDSVPPHHRRPVPEECLEREPHSMTWSARTSSDGGMIRPRVLAVLRLRRAGTSSLAESESR
jgi:hypothetical protein